MFFTSGMDQKFKIWDTNSLQVVEEFSFGKKIYCHHMSTRNASSAKALVALALDNGDIRFVDINSGASTHTIKAHANGYCSCVQWSPSNSDILASAGLVIF